MTRPFAGVIFDLDGTLVDSLDDIGLAMNAALARFALPPHPMGSYREMVGDGAAVLARRASAGARGGLDASAKVDVDALTATYAEEYEARAHRSTTLYAGVAELLARLGDENVAMAVLSNKPEGFTRDLITIRFPDVPFRAVRGQRAGVPRKPDPTVAIEIARLMELETAAIAFVGDTAVDIETARAAGMIAVGVEWGFRGRDELISAGAQHVLQHPSDLLRI